MLQVSAMLIRYIIVVLVPFLCYVMGDNNTRSLTFVIDDTISMSNEINQVKEKTHKIFNAIQNSNESQIDEFIIVTFNDFSKSNDLHKLNRSHAKLLVIAKDEGKFEEALYSIKVSGGDDCPEMAMAGIELALKHSKPNSYVYVFTDAAAKDYGTFENIKSLSQKKMIQITFLLTGKCKKAPKEANVVYDKLATATSGQVFHLDKQDIKQIIEYIIANVQSKRTTLARKTFIRGCGNEFKFTVDSKVWYVLISVSAEDPVFDHVIGPGGVEAKIEKYVHTKHSYIVKLKGDPGEYIINITSCDETSIVVTASTSVSFMYGFSPTKPSSLDETSTRPISDKQSYLAIELDNIENDVTLETVQLRDIDDNVIKELALELTDRDKQFYTTELFDPPKKIFKIAIIGHTKIKEKIKRVSQTSLEHYKPTIEVKADEISPSVTILAKEDVVAEYNKPVTLKCKVKAYPEPKITWEDELHSVWPTTVNFDPPYIYISTLEVEKLSKQSTFICKAIVSFNEYSDTIKVIPKNKTFLTVLEFPTDIAVEIGRSVEFNYKINALPPATIIWYRDNNTIKNNDYFEISPDSSILKIKNTQPRLGGTYLVEASNAHETKKYEFTVTVVGTEKPIIDKNVTIYTKGLNSNVELLCRVMQGKPKPLITWEFAYNYLEKFIKLTNTNEILHMKNLVVNNIGTYRCSAENEIGKDFHEMELFLEHSPTVKVESRWFKALKGKQVKLDCIVEGLPVPKVKWLCNEKEIKYGSKYKIFRNNSLSFTGTREDSGKYVCEATNYLDTARKSVKVIIYEPVKIETPEQSIFNATLRQSLTLPCRASGYPTPAVNWEYYSFESKKPIQLEDFVNKSLEIEHIQLAHEGIYKCFANNDVDHDDITYEIYVPAGAWITENSNNKVEVVVGDPKLELTCSAFGSPKPNITWTMDKSTIKSDSGPYKVETNGNLILSNITMKTKGTYTCKAENAIASDKVEYEVEVHSYPPISEYPPVVLLREGSTNSMLCGIPLKSEYFVRWFKDGKLIKTGELTLINVTKLDAGYYTCRVNTVKQSFSFSKRVIVGTTPNFITVNFTQTITFKEGAWAELDCSAAGDPPPTTKWMMDNKKINETSQSYKFIMNKQNIKLYKCVMSNEFGTISRTFDISGGECLLNLEDDLTARQPLLLPDSRQRRLPLFKKNDGYLKIPKYNTFQIWCPESFISYGGNNYGLSANISCIDGSVFKLGDINASFSEIICQKPIIPLAIKIDNAKCSGPNKKYFKIGFDVNKSFRPIYSICFDIDKNIPVFAIHSIHPFLANMVPKHVVGYFESTHINLQHEDVYNCRNQLDPISAFAGEKLKKDDICCFSRRQLVNPKDVVPGISQVATYHYSNVVPQWSTCGTENWDDVERRVRSYMLDVNEAIKLWTGTSNGKTRIGDGIYLKDDRGQQLHVPQYIWKVIYKQLAIIHINIPYLKTSQTTDYILCKDICDTVEWMKSAQWHDVEKGFIYCCDIKEFATAFNFEYLF